MEITFNPDDPKERKRIQDNLEFWYGCENNTSQSTLTNNNTNICSECGVKIFEKYPEDEAKKVINFCKVKYKNKKTLCKDCQREK